MNNKRTWRVLFLVPLLGFVISSGVTAAGASNDPSQPSAQYSKELEQIIGSVKSPRSLVKKVAILREAGGRVAWSPQGDLIAIDKKGADGYYDLYLIRPDGSDWEQCLTCDTNGVIPSGHSGQPAWHPSGNYLVFQAQKKQTVRSWGKSLAAQPGLGRYTDLWLIEVGTKRFFQLTHTADTDHTGILHPHFSHDGTKLTWTQMYQKPGFGQEAGYWKLHVADVRFVSGIPKLSNEQSYQPGRPGFYENDGLTPDGKKLLFSSSFEEEKGLKLFKLGNIYQYDIREKRLETLAREKYNEVPRYYPGRNRMIWMTSRENANNGTDYWSMNSDGSDKRRVTDFNNPNLPTYEKKMIISADSSFSPDGKRLAAYLQTNLLTQNGVTVILELDAD